MVSFLNKAGFVRGVSELSQESKVGLFLQKQLKSFITNVSLGVECGSVRTDLKNQKKKGYFEESQGKSWTIRQNQGTFFVFCKILHFPD